MRYVILFLILLPGVLGHLTEGEDIQIGDYTVDFGYSEELYADKPVTLAFHLVNATSQATVKVESLWLRIANTDVIFAGTLHPAEGNVLFTYTFPEPGDYTITARFSDDTEATFNVNVKRFSFVPLLLIMLFVFLIWKKL
ncbi:MAG: Ig-like domain-containing protein [Candidatus Nanoarchaeia archaeon]